jgi:hypothetical protein
MSSPDLFDLSNLIGFLDSDIEELRQTPFPPELCPDDRYHTVELALPKGDDVGRIAQVKIFSPLSNLRSDDAKPVARASHILVPVPRAAVLSGEQLPQ